MARLGRDDWVVAGYAALREQGPDAVAVQSLAAALGATKGSFYWHFGGREELLDAVLERWRAEGTERLIRDNEAAGGEPADRLRRLWGVVTAHSAATPGEQRILAAAGDPVVGAAVRAVVQRRIGYVARLLRQAGLSRGEAARRAAFAYSWYLGHAQLAAIAPDELPGRTGRDRTLDEAVELLLRPLP